LHELERMSGIYFDPEMTRVFVQSYRG